jgi:hypothetical protein
MVNDGLTPLPGHSPRWLGRAALAVESSNRCNRDAWDVGQLMRTFVVLRGQCS